MRQVDYLAIRFEVIAASAAGTREGIFYSQDCPCGQKTLFLNFVHLCSWKPAANKLRSCIGIENVGGGVNRWRTCGYCPQDRGV